MRRRVHIVDDNGEVLEVIEEENEENEEEVALDELYEAIYNANTLQELKSALLGATPNSRASVAARPVRKG